MVVAALTKRMDYRYQGTVDFPWTVQEEKNYSRKRTFSF